MGPWWHRLKEMIGGSATPIPEPLWQSTLERYPFLGRLEPQDLQQLRALSARFLRSKQFTGAHGLLITDEMALAIAAQACLPVLAMGLQPYEGFVGIVVHPGQARVRRSVADDAGVVHEYDDVLSGEAVQGGPVMLSWRDVRSAGPKAALGYNVVVHEFAHVLDMADGVPDGVPLLPRSLDREAWTDTLDREYEAFCRRVDAGEDTALDPYGAEGVDEFFAVASEAFFVAPAPMQAEHPALYALLRGYYRQDPAARESARRPA